MTDYALPITGTGSSQAVSAEAHDAEVQRAIDEAVAVEEARALLAEDALVSAIAAETAARITAVSAEQSARIAADNAEQLARIAGDASLSDAVDAETAARVAEDDALLALARVGDAIRLVGGSGTAQAVTYTVRPEQADLDPEFGSLIVFEWPADNTAADPVLTVGALSLTLRTPGGGAMAAGDLRASVTHIARVHSATTARVLTLTRIGGVNGLQDALDGKAASVHTHAASDISDSTAPGRAILTAATAAAQRTALGLGTAATTAASDYATAAQGVRADTAVQPPALAAESAARIAADTEIEARLNALIAGQRVRGTWTPASGFPPAGVAPAYSDAIVVGDAWIASSAGTAGGTDYEIGDTILALADVPDSADWARVPGLGSVALSAKANVDLSNVATDDVAEALRRAGTRSSGQAVFAPAFSRALISGGDGRYRHESTVCQAASGDLHVFWQGHPVSDLESAVGQRVYHAVSQDGGATWSNGVPIEFEDATNVLTPTNTQSQARCVAVGNEVWLFVGHRGTSAEEALILGRLTSAGVWTWYRLLVDAVTNVMEWSSSSLSGAAPAGKSVYYQIEGATCSLTATSILPRDDGGIDVLMVGVSGSFGGRHYMFLMQMAGDQSTIAVGSAVPSGVDQTPAPFEGALVRDQAGQYFIHGRRLLVFGGVSGIAISRGYRQFLAASPDGMGWTAAETTGMQVHSVRGSIAQLSPGRWVFAGNASWTTRNDVCIGLTRDPALMSLGPLVSAEDIATDYAEYPEVLIYNWAGQRRIGLSYSGRPQSAAAPCEIHWASCAAPNEAAFAGMVTAQRANRDDPAAVSSASGSIITIPPRASMSWEPTPYDIERRTIRWRVDTVPGGVPYIIASIGNYQSWTQVYLVPRSGEYVLKVDGQLLGAPIDDPTEWQTLTIEIDRRNGFCRVMGLSKSLPKGGITVTSGDAYDLTGFSSGSAGNLLIDVDASHVNEVQRLHYASVASTEGGPNRFMNPEFSVDQVNDGAEYGNGVGYKLDGVYLSDNGGCGLSISMGSFSVAAAQQNAGGVQSHLVVSRTSSGASAPRIEFELGDVMALAGSHVMIELDAYDGNGLLYPVDLFAVHNFGVGGAAQVETRVGNILIDQLNTRRHSVRLFWPTLNAEATFGDSSFVALQIRPAFHGLASNANLRIGRMDVHLGDLSRPFPRAGQADYLEMCQRHLHVVRSIEASANYGQAIGQSSTEARMVLPLPKMRAKPSLNLAAGASLQLSPGGGSSVAVTGVSIARQTDFSAEVVLTAAGGLTAGSAYHVRDANFATTPAHLRFSARYR